MHLGEFPHARAFIAAFLSHDIMRSEVKTPHKFLRDDSVCIVGLITLKQQH